MHQAASHRSVAPDEAETANSLSKPPRASIYHRETLQIRRMATEQNLAARRIKTAQTLTGGTNIVRQTASERWCAKP
ncbi:hypothetical protein EC9_04770 [Rosistilla ulvae]|uniref:Uncharacterized protein n=1 Tax=Rosistilla ulvae TaxID=1930277 RepID=A0A517LUL8_9BACT|nr:hypothetical protein [Rosistilla ulvae]QDS86316.1 hypothetical protein EC9_04770 [Rosistilla ulvae]